MVVRFFSALGWITLIFSMVVFLVSYASFPQEVLVLVDGVGQPQLYVEKGTLFYSLLAFAMLINAMAIGIKGVIKNHESTELMQISIHVSQMFFNMFFASSVYFINILNSRENFDYSNFGYLIYITGGLMVISIIFTFFSKMIPKKFN
ncbi:MAG: hypothetical protein ABFS32_12040 [Bacteroidota bacterium]